MNREILRLAIPNIITTLTVPLLSFADFALMGRVYDTAFINAVGIGTAIFNMIYWGFGFLRMGTTGLAAQAYGRQDKQSLSNTLYRAIFVGAVVAACLLIFQKPLLKLVLLAFEATDTEFDLAAKYYYIRIWAAPAALALYIMYGWFLGIQQAMYVMVVAVVLNLLNVGLNFFFVLGLGMDIDGIALATVISQYTGLLLTIVIILFKFREYLISWSAEVLGDMQAIKEFFSVNSDIFIRTVCLVFAFTFFTARSGVFGSEAMAVNLLLLQYMHLLSYGVDGFATAAESLVGKYYGATDKERFNKAIKYSFAWGLGLGAVYMLIFLAAGENILRLLTDIPEVIEQAQPYIWWVIAMPLINSVAFIWDGVYIGRTATPAMRNNMLIATFLLFVPAFYLTKGHIGNHSLWLAMTLFMVGRGLGLSITAPKAIFSWGKA